MNKKNINIRYISSFERINENTNYNSEYCLDNLSLGINFTEKHIISLSENNEIEWVTSRLCDHAGGTLEPCNEKKYAECPLHGWKLDLEKLHYCNVNVSKETLNFSVTGNTITVDEFDTYLQLPENLYTQQSADELTIRYVAHACLLFRCGNLKIITDPWLKGPCFLNAWWHKPAPSVDALDQLLDADVVYISHNHPDHMHEETLHYLYENRPNIPIIIPNFKTKSTETPLKNIGFTNVHTLAFNQIYQIDDQNIFVSILKSGDFRDDSGMYISYGQKQALITVDSSALNHYHLPRNIDFLATSFAAGASGHPWCFDYYSHEQKQNISNNRHKSVKLSVIKYIQACRSKAYMPYAGYFSEDAPRDRYIKAHNKKNTPQIIEELIADEQPNVYFINPIDTDTIKIGKTITCSTSGILRDEHIAGKTIEQYLSREVLPDLGVLIENLVEYFKHSNFNDSLLLYLIPCDSGFNYYTQGLIVDFSDLKKLKILPSTEVENCYQSEQTKARQLFIKVRAKPLWQVISNLKSWEELSIGYHCRIHRKPDVYNSDFWYYFSNIYIK